MGWLESSLVVGCRMAYYLQDVDACSITKSLLTKCVKSKSCMLSISQTAQPQVLLLDSDNTIRIFDKHGTPLFPAVPIPAVHV